MIHSDRFKAVLYTNVIFVDYSTPHLSKINPEIPYKRETPTRKCKVLVANKNLQILPMVENQFSVKCTV